MTDTSRCTRLGEVSTVEHLMAALAATGITDAEIEVTGGELPALDGASLSFFAEIKATGTREIGCLTVRGPFARVFTHEDEAKVAIAAGSGHWRYEFSSTERWPYSQFFETQQIQTDFESEVAPARTWGFHDEIEHLHAMGLAKGLSLGQALVLGKEGYVNAPKFSNEPSRHKLLDLVGDLYLSGVPISALSVSAERSGHRLNVEAAARLAAAVEVTRT